MIGPFATSGMNFATNWPVPEPRRGQLDAFLSRTGWAEASVETLGSDASRRRYHRVWSPVTGLSAMVMDAPPEAGEDIRPFVRVAAMLRRCGLSAPETWEADEKAGFLLLEDFGDAQFASVCSGHPEMEFELYAAAVDALVRLHRHSPTGLEPYDRETCTSESRLFTSWFLPAVTGRPVVAGTEDEFLSLVVRAFDETCSIPEADRVIVLRDYHAENIMWLSDRDDEHRAGILDFQDAVAGHPAYDLVSLLEDARRDTSESLQESVKGRYIGSVFGSRETEAFQEETRAFEAAYAVLGAQRNLRILGVFSRLCIRDGKFTYVDLIPRVWGHLQKDLKHPALAELAEWILREVPHPGEGILSRIRKRAHGS